MVEGGGILTLRDAEPYEIQAPTAITGTYDGPDEGTDDPGTGAITAGTFTTPAVSFDQEITSPLVATVYIDAAFSQVSPGNLTGTVDVDGNVFVEVTLAVDLHIDVGRSPTIMSADCVASPISLNLSSVAPLDPETGLVTLVDGNFTVPPVADSSACSSYVAPSVNEQLAGAGHAISLTLQGNLPPPVDPGEPAEVALSVTPAGGAQAGEPVTLSATVAAGPGAGTTTSPTGSVQFVASGAVVGSAPLAGGVAELVTTALPSGTLEVVARYRGDDVYGPTSSAPLTYVVYSNPALVGALPGLVQIGGAPADFTVELVNTGFGEDLVHVRLDVTITRADGSGSIHPGSEGERIVLEDLGQGDPTPVPLTAYSVSARQHLSGSIGASTGTALAPGQARAVPLRLTLPDVGTATTACNLTTSKTCPGPLLVTFDLQRVDPATGEVVATLASEVGQVIMTEATRRPMAMTAGSEGLYIEGLGWLVPPAPEVIPHTVRAGNSITLNQFSLYAVPALVGMARPEGTLSARLDGQEVGILPQGGSPPYALEVPARSGSLVVPVPVDVAPGTHTLTVRYSGDALYQPATASFALEVAPPVAPVYECRGVSLLTQYAARANVVAQGWLPPVVPAGSDVPVEHPVLRLLLDRGPSTQATAGPLGEAVEDFTALEVTYGVPGTAAAAGVTRSNQTRMDEAGDPDQVVELHGLDLAVTIDGAPGEAVPVAIESFALAYDGLGERLTCTPVGGPIVLGTVTVAGTTLSVAPEGGARAGSPVTLVAEVAPAAGGTVEFRDGTTTIGVTAVSAEGRATLVATLPEGERSLTARYLAGLAIPSTTSAPVVVTVLPTHDCGAFAVEGNGAVVRLVYMELLGRCPDQDGFDHWTGRLDGGTSPAVFARAIAGTSEAVGLVVDEAYRTMLDRAPDPAGRAFWTQRLQASGRYDRLLADLGASGEFWSRAGSTDQGFVTRVYTQILGRGPEPAGLAHWVGRLEAGAGRGALVQSLATLSEPLGILVDAAYADLLDRAPTGGERASGVAHLRATGDRSALAADLIARPEFTQRAQSFPNLA